MVWGQGNLDGECVTNINPRPVPLRKRNLRNKTAQPSIKQGKGSHCSFVAIIRRKFLVHQHHYLSELHRFYFTKKQLAYFTIQPNFPKPEYKDEKKIVKRSQIWFSS